MGTHTPQGYENLEAKRVAVDLEVIESVGVTADSYFHSESIKNHEYKRNSSVCKELCLRCDEPYQTARLFHRSLIKCLGGKQDVGVSVANEIAAFLYGGPSVTESDYKKEMTSLIKEYDAKYPLDVKYRELCLGLINS